MKNNLAVIGTTGFDEEIVSPKKYLKFSEEQRRDILEVKPLVKPLGSCNLEHDDFVAFHIKWKTPRYNVSF